MKKLVRITTVPISMDKLLEGQMRFMSRYYRVTAISSEREYLERIGGREGVATYCVDLTRRITPYKDFMAILSLWRFLRRERPHIVHSHTPKAGFAGMTAARLAGVPHRLHTVAGMPLTEASGFKKHILLVVERFTYAMASRIYPNSEGMKEFILTHRLCRRRKLMVIANGSSNGIDTNRFSREHFPDEVCAGIRNGFGIGGHETVFSFVGRMVAQKGVGELVAAFTAINAQYPFTRLILTGEQEKELDPLDKQTRQTISTHPAIICTGFMDDVRPILAVSDVFVLPSYREGFPNVLMQAGAMGLPCIATDIAGSREIITDGVNGLIVPVKNAGALRDAMERLAADKELRLSMAVLSRGMIADKYEQRYYWESLLKEYRSLDDQQYVSAH